MSIANSTDREPPVSENMVRVLRDNGDADPSHDPGLAPDEVTALYRHMVTTRIVDERLLTLQRQGRIGFHVGSLGEEAAIVGAAFALLPQDWLFPCYREFGAALLRGLSFEQLLDNVFGNAGDSAHGRQMPDHYVYRAGNYASTSSPVGTQIPHAVGVAWAAKLRGDDVTALAYFGDGATSTGDFHSALNFAAVFRVPAILLCRNNGWAISTPVHRQSATRTFAEKAVAYGAYGVRVDGNDALAMVSVTRAARQRGMRGEGPSLIEAITYRMGAHTSSDDPKRYRAEAELKPWVQRDPIQRLRRYLSQRGWWTQADEDHLHSEVEVRLSQTVAAAEAKAPPSLATLHADVLEQLSWNLEQQRAELLAGPRPAAPHG
ncbi:thiamine pyrophosphate-dependent dehydrogenase E1 component subunit alpha [Myxococcota bacterium]